MKAISYLFALLFTAASLSAAAPVFEFDKEDALAAQELREHLEAMYFDLGKSPFAGKTIRLGKKAGVADKEKCGKDGFYIKCKNGKLDIYGPDAKGTLNGVYHFLDEIMGVRWLTPEVTYFPENPQIKLDGMDICFKPVFNNRIILNIFAMNPVWCRRMRAAFNVEHEQKYNIPQGHNTFYFLCRGLEAEKGKSYTPKQAFDEFPEFFAEYVDHRGRRKRPFTFSQVCCSHPEVKRLITKGMITTLDKNPGLDFIDLSREDGPNPCECVKCEAEYVKRGKKSNTKSDHWFTFFRDIAAEVHKKYPDVMIGSFAYHTTQIPPDVHLGPNTCVRYCPIRMNYFHRVDEGDHNRTGGLLHDYAPGLSNIAGQIKEWTKHTELWLSLTMMKNPVYYPNPNLRSLAYNISFAAKAGAKSIFVEDLRWLPSHAQCNLRSYMLVKLMWNPYLDSDKYMREYCDLYFGKAGKWIMDYMTLLHDENSWDYKSDRKWLNWRFNFQDQWTEKRIIVSTWKWFFETPDPKVYYKKRFPFHVWGMHCPATGEFCIKSLAILKDAEKQVADNPVLVERVRNEMLPVYFISILTLPKDHPQTQEAAKVFFPAIEKIIANDDRLKNDPKKAEHLIHHGALKKFLEDGGKAAEPDVKPAAK